MKNQSIYLALASSAQAEERDLPSGKFVCRIGKGAAYSMCICAVVFTAMTVMGLIQEVVAFAAFFAPLGILAWLMFVYGLTYRCHVTRESLEESYSLLFYKKRQEVLWKDIQFQKVKRDQYGNILYLRFYDTRNRKLISFDYGVVGVEQIARMAKRKGIAKCK